MKRKKGLHISTEKYVGGKKEGAIPIVSIVPRA